MKHHQPIMRWNRSRLTPRVKTAAPGLMATAIAAVALLGITGCGQRILEGPPAAPPGPSYTGPEYLRGTVGSLARLKNSQPMPVSGFGFVVGLDGTGHRGAPAYLRQRMIQDMKKGGFGSAKLNTQGMTPERALDDMNTAVVAVEGLIPPGATKGTRFDVLVSALPATQTTSLAGGNLFSVDLAIGGADPAVRYSTPHARARGPVYLNPFDSQSQQEKNEEFLRQAIIVGGGEVTEDRQIEIVLNQPSWQRARSIEDRINERFPMAPEDRLTKTANAISNLVIRIHVPKRYSGDPQELLELIGRLYTNNAPGFEPMQARRLYEELSDDQTKERDVVLAWIALGRTIIPNLREYYLDGQSYVRLAALDAGARLQDERASKYLLELAGHPDPQVRSRVAEALSHLPRSIRGARALRQLLDDSDIEVRVNAYNSLAAIGDPIIDRMTVRNKAGVKFLIDRVPASKPMVYVTYIGIPRIVIFNPQLGFDNEAVARIWGNRLMLRTPETLGQALAGLETGGSVFLPITQRTKTQEIGTPRWQTQVTDLLGDKATLIIESKDLLNRFEKRVSTTAGDGPQAVIVAQLIDRSVNEQTFEVTTRLKLLDLRDADAVRPVMVYYQGPASPTGRTYKIAPTVATLAFMLAHESTLEQPQEGLDLTYSQVVDAIYHLCKTGYIDAPIEVDTTPLAALITRQDDTPAVGPRPETGDGERPDTIEQPPLIPAEIGQPATGIRPVTTDEPMIPREISESDGTRPETTAPEAGPEQSEGPDTDATRPEGTPSDVVPDDSDLSDEIDKFDFTTPETASR